MTATNLNSVLTPAMKEGYAIAGLVILGWEDAVAATEAAEEAGIPIILQAGPSCRKHTPVSVLGKMFRFLADAASVPIVCHIDHAYSFDECREGIENGFTSVMFDGSALPISENIERTQEISDLARKSNVSVEGEVGYVGYHNGVESIGTVPEEAAKFAMQSGVDAMAVSIGNIHLNTKKNAELDFQALSAIEAKASTMPLVIHGGSGVADNCRRKLVRTHVSKINIGTELRQTFGDSLKISIANQPDEFDRIKLLKPTVPVMRRKISDIIRTLRFPDGNCNSAI